jgi:hypothetical protein
MARRKLMESFKLQIKQYNLKTKKDQQQKDIPTFKNLNIDPTNLPIILIVDLLNQQETKTPTQINTIKKYSSTHLITHIQCPFCKQNIKINRHWNCYICTSPQHPKMIFEIRSTQYPQPLQIKQLPEDDFP